MSVEDAPIPWTASGRLLLGHLSDAEILALIDPDDFILPDGSRLAPATFIAEIRSACAAGFFSFDSIADTYTHCFAAPVQDASGLSIATLCIVAPRADAQAHHAEYAKAQHDNGNQNLDEGKTSLWLGQGRHGGTRSFYLMVNASGCNPDASIQPLVPFRTAV